MGLTLDDLPQFGRPPSSKRVASASSNSNGLYIRVNLNSSVVQCGINYYMYCVPHYHFEFNFPFSIFSSTRYGKPDKKHESSVA